MLNIKCSVDGCQNEILARGYCRKHYQQKRNSGEMRIVKKIERHGLRFSPEYQSWKAIKRRCYSKNHPEYYNYGGRGITVCDRWMDSFTAFYEDMGPRPIIKSEIDRIDNDKGYFKENCQWVTPAENCRKRNNTKLSIEKAREIRILYKSGDYYQKEIARKYGVSRSVIGRIVNNKIWKEGQCINDIL